MVWVLLSWPAWYVQAWDAEHKDICRRAHFKTPVITKWHKGADNTPGSTSATVTLFKDYQCDGSDTPGLLDITPPDLDYQEHVRRGTTVDALQSRLHLHQL